MSNVLDAFFSCLFSKYFRLLTRYPELCRLFRKFMTLRDDGTYDWDMEGLQRHALLVMQGLEAAVENLDDSRVLADILYELGRKHARFNVHEDMFDVSSR